VWPSSDHLRVSLSSHRMAKGHRIDRVERVEMDGKTHGILRSYAAVPPGNDKTVVVANSPGKVKRRSPALPFHEDASRPAYACNDKWRQAGAVDPETTQIGLAGIGSNASPPGAPESFPPQRNYSNGPGVSSAEDGPVPFNCCELAEAVGIPATFELCEAIIAPGGTIANVGVHGVKVDLHLENLWDRNITITTRLVDSVSTPMLVETLRSRRLDPKLLITHRFTFEQILDAYETFAHAADTRALKVIIAA